MSQPALFLFDIDGTLITSGGAGEEALRLTIRDRFQTEKGLEGLEISGRTDRFITVNVLRRFGIEPTPESIAAFLDHYLAHLAEQLPQREGRILPGILPLLDALKAREEITLALLTGNLARGAQLKLTHYGMWDYFEFGAYADDSDDRNRLGPVAQNRARESRGIDFPADRTFILGDTPHDIACGRVIGAKTVAIATGSFSVDELSIHQPDYLYEDLLDVGKVVSDLLGS